MLGLVLLINVGVFNLGNVVGVVLGGVVISLGLGYVVILVVGGLLVVLGLLLVWLGCSCIVVVEVC